MTFTLPARKFQLIGLIFAGLLFHGCAAAPPRQAPLDESILKNLCSRYDVEWSFDSVSQVVTLSRQGSKAKAMIGSDLVIIGDEKITLSGPLKRQKGAVIVPPDFRRKVIDRLTQKVEYVVKKFRKIILDPGHGGKDPGTTGRTGLKEKNVVLDIAKRLKKRLEEQGIDITMTRASDVFISLEDRARMANRSKADLFVSIHANYSRTRGVHGLEVYYLRHLDEATKREIRKTMNFNEMFRQFSMNQGEPALQQILLDMMYANKQTESRKLSGYLVRTTADSIKSEERGSKTAGFFVLKNTVIPAILVEVGFLSNKNEEYLLGTGEYRQEVADSLAKSIIEYANK